MTKGKNRAVSVQLSIHAPVGTLPEIIRQAIIYKCETGENTPGITITVVDWTGRREDTFSSDDAFYRLRHVIKRSHHRPE